MSILVDDELLIGRHTEGAGRLADDEISLAFGSRPVSDPRWQRYFFSTVRPNGSSLL
jgi:hypothetical protein